MSYISGTSRNQATLLPDCIEESPLTKGQKLQATAQTESGAARKRKKEALSQNEWVGGVSLPRRR
jgi:hypothetical protein